VRQKNYQQSYLLFSEQPLRIITQTFTYLLPVFSYIKSQVAFSICQAALCLSEMWPRCVYDACRKSCCRFIFRIWL